jgi:hypothetical protein
MRAVLLSHRGISKLIAAVAMLFISAGIYAHDNNDREKCVSRGGAWEINRNRCIFYPNGNEIARNECSTQGGTWEYSTGQGPLGWYCYPDNTERCNARGGVYTHVCSAGAPFCLIPTSDAGKTCTNSSQCEKGCLYVNRGRPSDPNELIEGKCAPDNYPTICKYHAFVEGVKMVLGPIK